MNNGNVATRFHILMLATGVLVATFGLGGCGDDGGGDGTGGGGGVFALNRYLREAAEIQCEQLTTCCPGGASGLPAGADCVDTFLEFYSDLGLDFEEQLRAGTIVVDQQAVNACLEEVRSASAGCSLTSSPEPSGGSPCDLVLRGTVAAGGACTIAEECVVGFCAFADEQATAGTCVTSTEGGPCALECGENLFSDGERECNQECSDGFTCDTFGESPTCEAFSSSSPGLGEACTAFCDSGLRCSTEGVCTEDLPAGSPCESFSDCDSGECSDEGVCVDVSICDAF